MSRKGEVLSLTAEEIEGENYESQKGDIFRFGHLEG